MYRAVGTVVQRRERRCPQVYATGDADDACHLAEHLLDKNPAMRPNCTCSPSSFSAGANRGTAAAAADTSVAAAPHAGALSDLGVMLRALGRLAEAEIIYRRAFSLTQRWFPRWATSATCCSTSGGTPRRRAVRGGLRLAPDQPWLLRDLALCFMGRAAHRTARKRRFARRGSRT